MTAPLLGMRILHNEKESLRLILRLSFFSLIGTTACFTGKVVHPYLSFSSLLSSCIKVLMSLNWR